MFQSDKVKGSFFLTTLHDTMDNIVDNLISHNITKYVNVKPKILDISDRHSLNQTGSSSAAYAARQNTGRQGRQNTRATKPRTVRKAPNERTWCKKQKLPFVGHLYSFYDVLRRHKEQLKKAANKFAPSSQRSGGFNRSSAGASGRGKRQKANGNAAGVDLDDAAYNSSTKVVALSATATASAASRNTVKTATRDFRALGAEIHRADSPLDGRQSSSSPIDLTADDWTPPKKRKRAIDDVSAHATIRRPNHPRATTTQT
ncbi:hypothetical protein J1614_003893 [Plenodomus biglobosus]|nr:hypothetical protein J1614_003893 [Plenodomus biglobosus]